LTEDVDMTAGTPHHLVRRQIRSRRRRASRKCRVKIKVNCNVCRTKCFNRYGWIELGKIYSVPRSTLAVIQLIPWRKER